MREFSCPDQRLRHEMTVTLESEQKGQDVLQDDMFYNLTESHSDFLNGKSIQEFKNLKNGTSNNIDSSALHCIDWSADVSITLDLDACTRNLSETNSYSNQRKHTSKYCEIDNNCILNRETKLIDSSYYCELKETRFKPSKSFEMIKIKRTKSIGKISAKRKEDKIYLEDTKDNLVCLNKQLEIQTIGKIDYYFFISYIVFQF